MASCRACSCKATFPVLASLMASCAASPATISEQASRKRQRPITVAVVDIQRVFLAFPQRMEMEADFTRRREKLDEAAQQRMQEIKRLEADLTVLAPDTSQYKQTEVRLGQKKSDLEQWSQEQRQALEQQAGTQIDRMYARVIQEVQSLAGREGYDLVLFKDSPAGTSQASTQRQIIATIQLRKVLYSSPELDVTERIIAAIQGSADKRDR
jgi:Skp family chaperone for outer membrane proteins